MGFRIVSIAARPLCVPLAEPFVIASGRMEETRAALVMATVVDEDTGARVVGLGEAATLPPVTREDLPDLFPAVARCHTELHGRLLTECTLPAVGPVVGAAVECALLDAEARLHGVPLWGLLRGGEMVGTVPLLRSDITLPIHTPTRMAELAAYWRAKGFTTFKVKVGIDVASDIAALEAITARVPDATVRVDANGGYDAATALDFYKAATRAGAAIECFEQPCPRDDLEGMATVTRAIDVPVVADESVRSVADLERVLERGAARAVNLKLVKSGVRGSLALGRHARALGMKLMFGAMVETRLGIAAAVHVCAALGGVDWVDLDTAWLMREEVFCGGYTDDGPVLRVSDNPGLGIVEIAAP